MASVRRLFNELEQTLSDYGINLGTKNLQIKDSKAFKDAYGAAFKVFGAEAHHIIDLAWVDRTLGAAGLGPESRSYVIEQLNKQGIDTGNQPLNISPQPQRRPKFGRTGMAHKWVHDLYKQIPSAEQIFDIDDISQLSEDDLVEYMVEAGRMRKQIVVDAMNHKLDSLRQAIPESANWSSDEIRQYANQNKKFWGSLGDDTFQKAVKLPDPTKIPTVEGQPRGRIPIRPDVEETLLARNLGYLAETPASAALSGAKQLVKDAPVGTALGLAGSLQDPAFQQAIEEGDLTKAGQVAGRDILMGAGAELGVKGGMVGLQKLAPAAAANLATLAPAVTVLGNAATGVGIATLAPSSVDPVIQERKNAEYRASRTPEELANPEPYVAPPREEAMVKAYESGPRRQLCFKAGTVCFKAPELGLSELFTGKFSGKEERAALNGSESTYNPTEIPNR